LNNNVFRLIINNPNLGTKVLKLFRNTIYEEYVKQYGKLIGFITFVEPPRTGAMYKADNWQYLGETQGKTVQKRNMGNWTNKEWGVGTKKHIFGKKIK